MQRARRAGLSALTVLVILIGAVAPRTDGEASPQLLADVSWPSSTLVVSEVQTGGTSASDEFVEVANQGAAPVDLGGLELVYVTASGTTVTRKATWVSPTMLDPGRGCAMPRRGSPTRDTLARVAPDVTIPDIDGSW